jgi:L-gulonate 5-dehydrogenase
MKSCVITEPLHYEIREVPIPEPKDDEVQIKMMAAGVCGSDIHIYKGENPCSRYPLVPGHENVGIITKVGKNCRRIRVGDHVVVDLIITCDTCYQCTHGRGNVCEHVLVRGSGTDGGWREYFTAIESDVYKIDDRIPWRDAALIEPLAIGEHCTSRGRVCADDVVFILGTGTIGTIIAQACKVKGAKTVICCDIDDTSLTRSRSFGADYTINSKTQNIVSEVARITNGHGCTVAFDSACFPGSLTLVLQPGIVCNAGRVVPMGFCTAPEAITQAMINQRELDIIGSRMSLHQFEPTAQKMAEGKYRLAGLATTFVPFREIDRVFQNIVHPNPAVKKTVILFDGAED